MWIVCVDKFLEFEHAYVADSDCETCACVEHTSKLSYLGIPHMHSITAAYHRVSLPDHIYRSSRESYRLPLQNRALTGSKVVCEDVRKSSAHIAKTCP